ncbi:MAG: hypothetical protein Q4B85_11075, partial [Lachnospiraceae bacterium]|nr:hypothetical protein [Lachnospiraceae bacterium]
SAVVHEQVAKRIANVRFTFRNKMELRICAILQEIEAIPQKTPLQHRFPLFLPYNIGKQSGATPLETIFSILTAFRDGFFSIKVTCFT